MKLIKCLNKPFILSALFCFSVFSFPNPASATFFSNGGFNCETEYDTNPDIGIVELSTSCSVNNGDVSASDLNVLINGSMGSDIPYQINGEPELRLGLNTRMLIDEDIQVSAIVSSGSNNGKIYFNTPGVTLTVYGGDIDQDGLMLDPDKGFITDPLNPGTFYEDIDSPGNFYLGAEGNETLNTGSLPEFEDGRDTPTGPPATSDLVPSSTNPSGFVIDTINTTGIFIEDPDNAGVYIPSVGTGVFAFDIDIDSPPPGVDDLTGWKHLGYKGDIGSESAYVLSVFFDEDATLEFKGDAYIKSINNDGTNIGNLIFSGSTYSTFPIYNNDLGDKNIQKIFTDIGITPPRLNSITIIGSVQFSGQGIYARTLNTSSSFTSAGLLDFEESYITGTSSISSDSSINLGNTYINSAVDFSALSAMTFADLDLGGNFATLIVASEITIEGDITGNGIIKGNSDSSADIIFASNIDQTLSANVAIGDFNDEISTIHINNIAQNQIYFNNDIYADNLSFGGTHQSILNIAASKTLNISKDILDSASKGAYIAGLGDIIINGINTDQVISVQIGESADSRFNELSIESIGSGKITFNSDVFVDSFDFNAAKTLEINGVFDVATSFDVVDDLTIQGIGTLNLGPVDISQSGKSLILEVDTSFDDFNFSQTNTSLVINNGNVLSITGDITVGVGVTGKIDGTGDGEGGVIFSGDANQTIDSNIGTAPTIRMASASVTNTNLVTFSQGVYTIDWTSEGEVTFEDDIYADNFTSNGIVNVTNNNLDADNLVTNEVINIDSGDIISENFTANAVVNLTAGDLNATSLTVNDVVNVVAGSVFSETLTLNNTLNINAGNLTADNLTLNGIVNIPVGNIISSVSAIVSGDSDLNGVNSNFADLTINQDQTLTFSNLAAVIDVSKNISGSGSLIGASAASTESITFSSTDLKQDVSVKIGVDVNNRFNSVIINNTATTIDPAKFDENMDYLQLSKLVMLSNDVFVNNLSITSGILGLTGNGSKIDISSDLDLSGKNLYILVSSDVVDPFGNIDLGLNDLIVDAATEIDIDYSSLTQSLADDGSVDYILVNANSVIGTYDNVNTLDNSDLYDTSVSIDVANGNLIVTIFRTDINNPITISGDLIISSDTTYSSINFTPASTDSVIINQDVTLNILGDVVGSATENIVGSANGFGNVVFAGIDVDQLVQVEMGTGSSDKLFSISSINNNNKIIFSEDVYVNNFLSSGEVEFGKDLDVDSFSTSDIVTVAGDVTSSLSFNINENSNLNGVNNSFADLNIADGKVLNFGGVNALINISGNASSQLGRITSTSSNATLTFLSTDSRQDVSLKIGSFDNRFGDIVINNTATTATSNRFDLSDLSYLQEDKLVMLFQDAYINNLTITNGILGITGNGSVVDINGDLDLSAKDLYILVGNDGSNPFGDINLGSNNLTIDGSTQIDIDYSAITGNLVVTGAVDYDIITAGSSAGSYNNLNTSDNSLLYDTVISIDDNDNLIVTVSRSNIDSPVDIADKITFRSDAIFSDINFSNDSSMVLDDGVTLTVTGNVTGTTERIYGTDDGNGNILFAGLDNQTIGVEIGGDSQGKVASISSINDDFTVTFEEDIYAVDISSSGNLTFDKNLNVDTFSSDGVVLISGDVNSSTSFTLNENSSLNGSSNNFKDLIIADNKIINLGNAIESNLNISGDISGDAEITATYTTANITLSGDSRQDISVKIGTDDTPIASLTIANTADVSSDMRFGGDASYLYSSQLAMFAQDVYLNSLAITSGILGISGNGSKIDINSNLDLSGKGLYILVDNDLFKPFANIDLNNNSLIIDADTTVDIDFSSFTGTLADSGSEEYTIITANSTSGTYDDLNTNDNSVLYDTVISVKGNDLIVTISQSNLLLGNNNQSIIYRNLSSIMTAGLFEDVPTAEEEETFIPSKSGSVSSVVADISASTNTVISSYVQNSNLAATGFATGNNKKDESGIWGQTFLGTSTQDDRNSVSGYDANFGGFVFGRDRTFKGDNTDIMLGAAFSYGMANIKDDSISKGNTTINSYKLILYNNNSPASKVGFYNENIANISFNQYKSSRTKIFNNIQASAKADFDGISFGFRTSLGYNGLINDNLLFNPFVGVGYSRFSQDEYTETENGVDMADVASEDVDRLSTELGLSIIGKIDYFEYTYLPKLTLSWTHQFKTDGQESNVTFIESQEKLSNNSLDIEGDMFRIGLGLGTAINNTHTIDVEYSLQKAQGFIGHVGQLKYRFSF